MNQGSHLLNVVKEMLTDLGEGVVDCVQSGRSFGVLDPSVLAVRGSNLVISHSFYLAPMQFNLIQQYKNLLRFFYAVENRGYECEADDFSSEIGKIFTVADVLFITIHPHLRTQRDSVKFVLNGMTMMLYCKDGFLVKQHEIGPILVWDWYTAFDNFHKLKIDVQYRIWSLPRGNLRSSLQRGLNFFINNSRLVYLQRPSSPACALNVVYNYYKHLYTSEDIVDIGDMHDGVFRILPQISMLLWQFLKHQFLVSPALFLDFDMLFKYRQVFYQNFLCFDGPTILVPNGKVYEIVVAGLSVESEDRIRDFFSRFGNVVAVTISPLSIVHVSFQEVGEAIAAIQGTDKQWNDGRQVSVVSISDELKSLRSFWTAYSPLFLSGKMEERCVDILRDVNGNLPAMLKNVDPFVIQLICNRMNKYPVVGWHEIVDHHGPKDVVGRMSMWHLLQPSLFSLSPRCWSPQRNLLLFGPEGSGKMLFAQGIAGEANATFFHYDAASLDTENGENVVIALFGVAKCKQPYVIFVENIDRVLSACESEGRDEEFMRTRNRFLKEKQTVEWEAGQVLVIGSSTRPEVLSEDVLNEFRNRLYLPLPSFEARWSIIEGYLEREGLFRLSRSDLHDICHMTAGYSGTELEAVVKLAVSLGPLSNFDSKISDDNFFAQETLLAVLLPLTTEDFRRATALLAPSVSADDVSAYEVWDMKNGSGTLGKRRS